MNKRLLLFLFAFLSFLSLYPDSPETFLANEYCYLADHFASVGNREKAIELYRKALLHQAESPHAHVQLGALYYEQNKPNEALPSYKKALATHHDVAHIYYNLGLCYIKLSAWQEALEEFAKVIERDPRHLQAHLHRGLACEKIDQFEAAIEAYHQAIAIDPHSFEAHHHLGNVLRHLERLDEAVEQYQKAADIQPDNIHVLMDLANVLNMLEHNEESLDLYKKIVEKNPNAISALYNFGFTLKKMGQLDRALEVYKQVLAKKPDYAPVHFSLSSIYLAMGDFERGWQEYEWRWKAYNENPKKFNCPLWQGEDLTDQSLLIYAEQGLGDTLQFIRYLKFLKMEYPTARLVFETQQPLTKLLQIQSYIDHVVARNEKIERCDYHIPLMSLPHILKTNEQSIPTLIPYIIPREERVQYWKEQLASDKNFKIGICWQGNARYSSQALRRAVASKSITLEQFKPLSELEGVSLYSLQQVDGTDQIMECSFKDKLITFDDQFDKKYGSFMDTAGLIPHLDLVVSVDTGVCHLAAAMGVKTWIPLPSPADWRWLRNRNDSPWYPDVVQLFRQPQANDWGSVMLAITQAVREQISLYHSHMRSLRSSTPTKEQEQFFEQLLSNLE